MDQMLERDGRLQRLLRPSRRVWFIVLATTEKPVKREDPDEKKIDSDFIKEEIGYLTSPLGVIKARKTPKPDMIIVCLNKFDLFSEYEPKSQFAREAVQRIEKIFNAHIAKIKQACDGGKTIPHIEVCSACEGWRVREIRDIIEQELYSGRK